MSRISAETKKNGNRMDGSCVALGCIRGVYKRMKRRGMNVVETDRSGPTHLGPATSNTTH